MSHLTDIRTHRMSIQQRLIALRIDHDLTQHAPNKPLGLQTPGG